MNIGRTKNGKRRKSETNSLWGGKLKKVPDKKKPFASAIAPTNRLAANCGNDGNDCND
jgi:hypothetical protein